MAKHRPNPFDPPPPEHRGRPDDDHGYRDALAVGPQRGRGASLNPGNRFEDVKLHVLGEHLDARQAEGETTRVLTRILPDRTRTLINPVDSPDLWFSWTLNPYRGCEHGCIYCYARPGHEYLGLSSGLDFETTILAKHDAPEILSRELAHPKWKGETIVLSGVTDPYQPIERDLRITRRCLEILVDAHHAVSLISKNHLITRDLDLFQRLHAHASVRVAISLTTLDNALARTMEPRASSPAARLQAIRELSSAGIPVTVMTAPIIPRINDHEIPRLLEAAADAGASAAGMVILRLPYQIKALFLNWLKRHFPDRAAHVESLIRDTRGGDLYQSDFFTRHQGQGPIAQQIARTFNVFAKRFGLTRPRTPINEAAFRRPNLGGQLALFGAE